MFVLIMVFLNGTSISTQQIEYKSEKVCNETAKSVVNLRYLYASYCIKKG